MSPYQYNDGFMSAAWRPITCYGRRPEVALAEWDPLPRTCEHGWALPQATLLIWRAGLTESVQVRRPAGMCCAPETRGPTIG